MPSSLVSRTFTLLRIRAELQQPFHACNPPVTRPRARLGGGTESVAISDGIRATPLGRGDRAARRAPARRYRSPAINEVGAERERCARSSGSRCAAQLAPWGIRGRSFGALDERPADGRGARLR